jgi:hypothetical protein
MSERVSNEMVDMVQLFAQDRRLRAWFATVEEQPSPARAAAFEKMVSIRLAKNTTRWFQ